MRLTAALLAVILFMTTAIARTWYILPDETGEAPTIQAGIDSAALGDTILLGEGTYTGDGNRDIDYQGKDVVVRSENGNPDACIIDCQGSSGDPHRGFLFQFGEGPGSVLEGVTITNGCVVWPDRNGGGVYCDSLCSPTLTDCIFLSNSSEYWGGGMYCVCSEVVLVRCAFLDNDGTWGAGVYCDSSSATFINCTFSGNAAGNGGGGMDCERSSSPTLDSCVFSGNSAAVMGGGGLYMDNSFPVLTNCEFTGNWTGEFIFTAWGGGILCVSSSPNLSDCILSGNSANKDGGGMFCYNADPMLANCTFSRNRTTNALFGGGGFSCANESYPYLVDCTFSGNASVRGGGVFCFDTSSVTLENTIVAFSTQGEGVICDSTADVTLICCDVYGNVGGDWVGCIASQYETNGNICEDPLFCCAGSEDFHLRPESPCAPFTLPNPECDLIGAWPVGCIWTDVASGNGIEMPCHLFENHPNPFNPTTSIQFELPREEQVHLAIFDVAGRLIDVLVDGKRSVGRFSEVWEGKDRNGVSVPSGIYFARLQAGEFTATRKMVLIR